MLLPLLLALQTAAPSAGTAPPVEPPIVTTPSGLRFQVLQPGTGRRPTRADAAVVTFQVRLAADGRVVERTADTAGIPVGGSIPGVTEALLMMNEGGRYRFWVPARLAYGHRGNPGMVPPDADLIFEMSLLRLGRPAQPRRR